MMVALRRDVYLRQFHYSLPPSFRYAPFVRHVDVVDHGEVEQGDKHEREATDVVPVQGLDVRHGGQFLLTHTNHECRHGQDGSDTDTHSGRGTMPVEPERQPRDDGDKHRRDVVPSQIESKATMKVNVKRQDSKITWTGITVITVIQRKILGKNLMY